MQTKEDLQWHKYLVPSLGSNFYKTVPLPSSTGSTTGSRTGKSEISEADDAVLQELMREMHVVLRGGSFLEALHSSTEMLIGLVADEILPDATSSPDSATEKDSVPVNAKPMATKPVPLAKLLPRVAVASSTLLDGTSGKVNVLAFLQAPSVISFCAGVYSDDGEVR